MTHTVVILGAGHAGLPAAHSILKHQAEKFDLKVVLVSPSDDYYWPIATPRIIVPNQMADDKIFFHIPKLFEKYPSARFEFVHGKAETWNPDDNAVLVTLNDGSSRTVEYHTIIVATGSSAQAQMPWKLLDNSKQTRAALDDFRRRVRDAESIVIGGAGPTGVEIAGELGSAYAKLGKKSVTLITSNSMVLEDRIMTKVRTEAMAKLGKLKVNVRTSTRITNTTEDDDGATTIQLSHSNGTNESIKADLFIPSWGLKFNTGFAPASLLEPNGRFKITDKRQAPGYKNTFIVGDVADGEPLQIMFAETHVKHVVAALEQYFTGGEIPKYVPRTWSGHVVSVGRDYGAGEVAGWKLWGWLVWFLKSRHLGTNYAPDCAEGKRFVTLGSI
ncbi:hypothetical protein B0I35DRAFT_359889 [Stachybotrys elegans]|uniref:FAD/NAD(P)-binding domain-containing protein n=1 Tax=Stachybotrys elegans TaxID=80388 RepID=A0A8K0WLN8_9HYPO|nr:hypothetical protein B0I35DRAFT_359889 [Stachybotrys elegans]